MTTSTATVYDFTKLLQDAKAGNAWPEGDYDFEVVEADATIASTGSNMIKTKLRCLVGTYAGKTVTNNFVLVPDNSAALMMFFRHMAAFGLNEDWFRAAGTGDLSPVAAALRGRRARITLGHRTWQDMKQNNVTAVKPITDGLAGGPQLGAALPSPGITAPPPAVNVPAPPNLTVVPPPPQPIAPAVPALGQVPPPPTPPVGPEITAQPAGTIPPPPPPPSPSPVPPPTPTPPTPGPVPMVQPTTALPPGYTAELWASIPPAAQQAILQAASAQPI